MNPTSKTPGIGPGLHDYTQQVELASQLYGTRDAGRSVCGCMSPTPAPRSRYVIARDLQFAAEALGEAARRIADGDDTLFCADALITGCVRLMAELCQGGRDGQ